MKTQVILVDCGVDLIAGAILSSVACAVKATLGFEDGYLIAWRLY